MTTLDADGQPSPLYNHARRADRDVSEMLGLVKGILADGIVTEGEARMLRDWVHRHPDAVATWPGDVLLDRLYRIFADGVVDDFERRDLANLLRELVGGEAGVLVEDTAALPLDSPPPVIAFDGRIFVLTGKLVLGPRRACAQQIAAAGGEVAKGITKHTDYLVIGTFGRRDWAQTSHGQELEKAVLYHTGHGLSIVSENHWANELRRARGTPDYI